MNNKKRVKKVNDRPIILCGFGVMSLIIVSQQWSMYEMRSDVVAAQVKMVSALERQVMRSESPTGARHVASGGDAPGPSTLAAGAMTSASTSPRGEPPQQLASLGNLADEGAGAKTPLNHAPAPNFNDGPHMGDSYLADYAYSEVPPDVSPSKIVLASLEGVPEGTPMEEIKRASEAFGLDYNFMRSVAKIESDFDPKNRTGKYVGLFQLSPYEFDKYGSGSITNGRANAIAAAYKFAVAAKLFEIETHQQITPEYLYLIHQQGEQGAAQHVSHPDRVAWQSMCATDEGREKGEGWCKRAIWENTLPSVKKNAGSVDKLLSGDFVEMWSVRVKKFLSQFSGTTAVAAATTSKPDKKHEAKAEKDRKEKHKEVEHHSHRHKKA